MQTDETLAEVRVTVLFLWSWAGSEVEPEARLQIFTIQRIYDAAFSLGVYYLFLNRLTCHGWRMGFTEQWRLT